MKPTKHYRKIEAKTLSKVSASGSSSLFCPFSSKRGGSSIVASDASDPGDSSRWCLLRLLPDSLELCELSSSRCRLRLLCPRCSLSLSSPSGEGSREGSRAGSSCGSRLNLTLFSSSGAGGAGGVGGVGGAGLGLRDFSTGHYRPYDGVGHSKHRVVEEAHTGFRHGHRYEADGCIAMDGWVRKRY